MSGFGTTIDAMLMAAPVAAVALLVALWLLLPRVESMLRRPRARWIAAGIVFLAVLAAGSPVLLTSFDLSSQRRAIVAQLAQADLKERNPITVELLEHGRVTVGERVYESIHLKRAGEDAFDQRSGKLEHQEQIAEFLLAPSMPRWAPPSIMNTTGVAAVVAGGALLGAGAVLLGLAPLLAAVLLVAGGAASMALLGGRLQLLIALAGMVVLVTGYAVLGSLLLRVVSAAHPTSAVANIVMRESTRKWYTGAFILVLLVALPLVPLAIEANDPLRYRVQTFLGWSLAVTFASAALLTLVLSCSTVALEIRDRQIWQTLTKPVERLSYILGKWLGVVGVTFVMLAVSGLSILLFVEYMRTQPAQNLMDQLAVRDEVLVARLGARPEYRVLPKEQVDAAVTERMAADPSISADIQNGVRREIDIRRMLAEQIRSEDFSRQRSVEPGRLESYVFRGLDRARDLGGTVTLTFLLHIGASDPHTQHPVTFRLKDGTQISRIYVPAQRHVLQIPVEYIEPDGTLTVQIGNLGLRGDEELPGESTLMWDADGIEVLFKVGGFEANFLRALLLEWTKLAFLAMLGCCCGTVLSFPVALLFTATVFSIGSLTPFLAEAIEYYTVEPSEPVLVQAFHAVILAIAIAAHWLLSGFGAVSGETLLVEGRLVSWAMVARAFLVLGVVWSGGALLVGWLAFRRKEIAIYSGQGG